MFFGENKQSVPNHISVGQTLQKTAANSGI